MTDESGAAARLRVWLRWFLYGDLSFDWLRPRRARLPAVMVGTLVALVVLHEPVGATGHCVEVGSCLRFLQSMAEFEPGVLAGAVGLNLSAAATVYVAGSGVTSLVGRRVDLEAVAPWLFAPDDLTLRGVAVVGLAALLAYVAGAYNLAYTLVGAGVLYVLYFPVLVPVAAIQAFDPLAPLPEYLAIPVAVVVLVSLPLLEVAWLYALARLAVSPFASDDDPDWTVHH